MDLQSVRNSIFPVLKDKGFVSTSHKTIVVKDCGFFLIVAEVQHLHDIGFFLNMGVDFLWTTFNGIKYDYPYFNNRINSPCTTFGGVLFDSPTADFELKHIMENAQEKVAEYQSMKNFDVFRSKIESQHDFEKSITKDLKRVDVEFAIVKMFSSESAKALEILNSLPANSEFAKELLLHCDDVASFHKSLVDMVNNCRKEMAAKLKIKLEPISAIFSDFTIS